MRKSRRRKLVQLAVPEPTEVRIHKYPCYTTSTGIRIGSMYTPPQQNLMSFEDEFWQRRLLPRFKSVQQIGISYELVDAVIGYTCAIGVITTALVLILN